MDIQQLKLLAGRVRGLLEQSHHSIGHNQSLDLIAALPGLRNWPEVQAFPDRVSACELDVASASRLAFRLKKRFALEHSPQAMLAALSPPGVEKRAHAPEIWPTGPAAGVYITDTQDAINALLERYEEATDGALVYAERAASHWEGSIDLGEGGLWSNGLQRVPSGTLLVVGPLELNQQSWSESSSHLEMACLVAQSSEHRVAVLIDTPTPQTMLEDVELMVRSVQSEGGDCDAALLGVVTADGELEQRQPFATSRPAPQLIRSLATVEAIPSAALSLLKKAIENRTAGLLLFGSSELTEHHGVELVAASLALTEHAGPAARIMPRRRSTPAKDWQVPEAIKQLPFLPSIESAYEQGFRRMLFEPGYTPSELLLEFSKDVLFIAGVYGSNVDDIFMSMLRFGGPHKEDALLAEVIAILGVRETRTKRSTTLISDLYLQPQEKFAVPTDLEAMLEYLRNTCTLRWEDEMERLLRAGDITPTVIKKSLPRDRAVADFLSKRIGKSNQ